MYITESVQTANEWTQYTWHDNVIASLLKSIIESKNIWKLIKKRSLETKSLIIGGHGPWIRFWHQEVVFEAMSLKSGNSNSNYQYAYTTRLLFYAD